MVVWTGWSYSRASGRQAARGDRRRPTGRCVHLRPSAQHSGDRRVLPLTSYGACAPRRGSSLEDFLLLAEGCKHLVVFTGSGVSATSGAAAVTREGQGAAGRTAPFAPALFSDVGALCHIRPAAPWPSNPALPCLSAPFGLADYDRHVHVQHNQRAV